MKAEKLADYALMWIGILSLSLLLLYLAGGCVSTPGIQDAASTVDAPVSPTVVDPVLSPTVTSSETAAPVAESQGWLSYLSQKTTQGIDPLWYLALLMCQTWLSHRREVMRIRQRT